MYAAIGPDKQRMYFDVVGGQMEVGGARVRKKPTVLCLHGGPGLDHTYLRPDLERLGKAAQLIFVDDWGCGRSDALPAYSWDVTLGSFDALRAHLGIERWFVFGHASGGNFALRYALAFPDVVRGLILADTPVDGPTGAERMATLAETAGVGGAEVFAPALSGDAPFDPEIVTAYFSAAWPAYWAGDDPRPFFAAALRTRQREDAGIAMAVSIYTEDITPRLAELHTPAVVLVGEKDGITPPEEAEELTAALGDARLVIIPDAAHVPFIEQPEEFDRAVLAFLASFAGP